MEWDARVCERSPLFWPIRAHARVFHEHRAWPTVSEYDRLVDPSDPLRFQPSPPRPRRARRERIDPSRLYDGRICEEGVVPTRARSWHDFFNALVWAAFPATKRRLHQRQHRAIAARVGAAAITLPPARTREQDGLALFDEGGLALLCAPDAADEARRALDERRPERVARLVADARALGVIYGHAVYEHLARGGPPVRAMTTVVPCPAIPADPAACVAHCDAAFAAALEDPASFQRPDELRSLPADAAVLGWR